MPVVLTCKQTLRETIAEALSEFQLHEQDPRLYALCLNFQELTVRLSESAFHNLPTVGRPPQLRLISLKDLKELSKAQLKHRAWDDSQADVFAQSSQQSDDHSHTTPTASTSQHGSQPKKRGRRSSQFSSSTSAANPAALWIAGGPGQGGDDDTGQRYRKRRMILGQPGQSTQRHRDEDDSDIPLQSDPHPTVADHSAQLGDENPEDAPSSPRKRARPRRSAASSAAEAIARHNSSNGHTVPTPAHTSLPAASAVTKIGVKRGRRPRKSRSHEAEADHQRVEDENQENQPHLPSDRLSSALGQSQSESNASLPIPYPMLLDNETHSDETAPLQCGVDLPDAAVSWLQKLPEPDRSREWLQICFEQFTDASILQKEVWQACAFIYSRLITTTDEPPWARSKAHFAIRARVCRSSTSAGFNRVCLISKSIVNASLMERAS